jgi:hypothetical protein
MASDMERGLQQVIRNILNDIKVELGDEFDRNFERQGFFSEKWQRRKSPTRAGGAILVDALRLHPQRGRRDQRTWPLQSSGLQNRATACKPPNRARQGRTSGLYS